MQMTEEINKWKFEYPDYKVFSKIQKAFKSLCKNEQEEERFEKLYLTENSL